MSDTPRTAAIMAMVRALDRHELGHEHRIAMREGAECGIAQLELELAEARRTINEITGPLVLCGEAEVRDVQGFREKIIAMREAMIGYRQELAEAQRKLEVWSLRYAGLEVLYLAAMKS